MKSKFSHVIKLMMVITCVISLFGCKQNTTSNKVPVYNIDVTRTLDDYKSNISKVKGILNNNFVLDDLAVESVIPVNLEEFKFFYGLTYTTEEDWSFFEKINEMIVIKSQSSVGNCIERYLGLAEFVDGEYAEGFYADVFFIVERNPNKFCSIFDNLSIVSQQNLSDIHQEFCKAN